MLLLLQSRAINTSYVDILIQKLQMKFILKAYISFSLAMGMGKIGFVMIGSKVLRSGWFAWGVDPLCREVQLFIVLLSSAQICFCQTISQNRYAKTTLTVPFLQPYCLVNIEINVINFNWIINKPPFVTGTNANM